MNRFVTRAADDYDIFQSLVTHLHFQLLELKKRGDLWVPRYVNAMGNTSDRLYYLTGDTGGLVTVLKNAFELLMFWKARSNP